MTAAQNLSLGVQKHLTKSSGLFYSYKLLAADCKSAHAATQGSHHAGRQLIINSDFLHKIYKKQRLHHGLLSSNEDKPVL
jgi:hypothetical protein